ncbi:MAG: hypothetical protein ABW026_10050 [Microvirga sp.]
MADHARMLFWGGPFDHEEAALLPPDTVAPVQIVWSGWSPQGFTAWLYEWHGEVATDGGFTRCLIYRPTGRRLRPEEIPPQVADDVDLWSDGAALLVKGYDVPAELMWPGV